MPAEGNDRSTCTHRPTKIGYLNTLSELHVQ